MSVTIQGTAGYCDPDYLRTGQSSQRIDVYSFGIVLLELITGKGPHKVNRPYRYDVKDRYDRGGLPAIVDASMGLYPADEVIRVLDVALRCTEIQDPSSRPTMSRVVAELEAVLEPESASHIRASAAQAAATAAAASAVTASSSANANRASSAQGSDQASQVSEAQQASAAAQPRSTSRRTAGPPEWKGRGSGSQGSGGAEGGAVAAVASSSGSESGRELTLGADLARNDRSSWDRGGLPPLPGSPLIAEQGNVARPSSERQEGSGRGDERREPSGAAEEDSLTDEFSGFDRSGVFSYGAMPPA
eukprot:TRINITY_DN14758_c1_g2_i1.p1 TRINITY_DN14758_c1_g2~~TRINITY_DN14758_c1_g2_i1.p1  ORF type:complete len:347 (-),score=10.54 TRINITY_DN14758_c1_g2_i1:124-1035(-)